MEEIPKRFAMDSMNAHIHELTDQVLYFRNNMGEQVDLGYMPGFKEIKEEAQMFGLSVCACLICTYPVKDATLFTTNGSKGLFTICIHMHETRESIGTKKSKRKTQRRS